MSSSFSFLGIELIKPILFSIVVVVILVHRGDQPVVCLLGATIERNTARGGLSSVEPDLRKLLTRRCSKTSVRLHFACCCKFVFHFFIFPGLLLPRSMYHCSLCRFLFVPPVSSGLRNWFTSSSHLFVGLPTALYAFVPSL